MHLGDLVPPAKCISPSTMERRKVWKRCMMCSSHLVNYLCIFHNLPKWSKLMDNWRQISKISHHVQYKRRGIDGPCNYCSQTLVLRSRLVIVQIIWAPLDSLVPHPSDPPHSGVLWCCDCVRLSVSLGASFKSVSSCWSISQPYVETLGPCIFRSGSGYISSSWKIPTPLSLATRPFAKHKSRVCSQCRQNMSECFLNM